jgi:hypothetical protein
MLFTYFGIRVGGINFFYFLLSSYNEERASKPYNKVTKAIIICFVMLLNSFPQSYCFSF